MIKILDAIMGSGKTSAAINFINESASKERFIFVTPYLTEVGRIKVLTNLVEPVSYNASTPKMVDFMKLLDQGVNIVTTHALFSLFNEEVINLVKKQGYTLIMDEVTSVIEPYSMKKSDVETLVQQHTHTDDDSSLLIWNDGVDSDKFIEEKMLCDSKLLYKYVDNTIIQLYPIEVFKSFKDVYVLTYMFEAQLQKYYFDYYGMKYEYIYVDSTYHFTSEPYIHKTGKDLKPLINVLDDYKLNEIGEDRFSLSKKWYKETKDLSVLRNNLFNYFHNKLVLPTSDGYKKSSSKHNLWTTFVGFKDELKGKGYTKGFIPCNMRGTNDFRSRSVVAYCINRYINPVIKNFFMNNGIEVDSDTYALSEMLQFIWRSAIRDNKPITVYIPSKRMRDLLLNWLET